MTYSLLAGGLKAIEKYLPTIAIAVGVALVLIAFFIGFARGGRKVSWAGFTWALIMVAYVLIEKFLGAKLDSAFGSKLAGKLNAQAAAMISTLLSACIAVLGVLFFYGIFKVIFRPHYKRVDVHGDRFVADDDGIEYDEDADDYDDYEEYKARGMTVRVGYGKPGIFGRLFGGIICAVNTAVIAGVSVLFVLSVLSITPLKSGALAPVYEMKGVDKLIILCKKYLLDALLIGVFALFAGKGFNVGAMSSLRILIVKLGGFAASIFAFYLPFSKFAKTGFFLKFVKKCIGAAGSIGIPAAATGIVGKILAGFILCVAAVLALVIINVFLKMLASVIKKFGFFRVIDGAISAIVFLFIGILLCVLVFSAIAACAHFDFFNLGKMFDGTVSLASEMFETCFVYVSKIFDKLKGALSKIGK
ncbi:MAG: hypothetical protein IJX88_00815 [Clostridia bacterium]|nr:hypothetical protein [Clostridia bacterium]